MSKLHLKLAFCISLLMSLQTVVAADATKVELSNIPLPTLSGVDPNVIMILDDSGSMDAETLFPTENGYLYPVKDQVAADGKLIVPNSRGATNYSYLFPVISAIDSRWSGYRIYHTRDHVVPPFRKYAFARSPDFNSMYYDPAVTYKPWPSYGDLKVEYPAAGIEKSYFDMARWPWQSNEPSVSMSLFEEQKTEVIEPECGRWSCTILVPEHDADRGTTTR